MRPVFGQTGVGVLLCVCTWALFACASEIAPKVVVPEPVASPPQPLGRIVSLELSGSLTWTTGEPGRLDVSATVALEGDAHLAVTVMDADGHRLEDVPMAISQPLRMDSEVSWVALSLQSEGLPAGDYALDFVLVSGPDTPAPRSPVVRVPLLLTETRTPRAVAHPRIHETPIGVGGLVCEDGRVITEDHGGLLIVESAELGAPLRHIVVEGLDGPLEDLLVDWRCTRAFGRIGERFVAFDVINGRVTFDEDVPGLSAIVFDANERYLLLLLSDGGIRRFYLRDDEWSVYSGRFAAAPVRRDGELVVARDEHRVAVLVEGPAVCLLFDKKKVKPVCVDLPFGGISALSWLPFGLADETWAPTDVERAKIRYEDDLEAREAAPAIGSMLVLADSSLHVFGVDAATTVRSWELGVDGPHTLRLDGGAVHVLGATHSATYAPLDVGLLSTEALASLDLDPTTRRWFDMDSGSVAVARDWGVELLGRDGQRVGFVVIAETQNVLWSQAGDRVAVLGATDVVIVEPDGTTVLRPESRD